MSPGILIEMASRLGLRCEDMLRWCTRNLMALYSINLEISEASTVDMLVLAVSGDCGLGTPGNYRQTL